MKVIFFFRSFQKGELKHRPSFIKAFGSNSKKRSEANQKTREKNSSSLQQEDERFWERTKQWGCMVWQTHKKVRLYMLVLTLRLWTNKHVGVHCHPFLDRVETICNLAWLCRLSDYCGVDECLENFIGTLRPFDEGEGRGKGRETHLAAGTHSCCWSISSIKGV